MKRLFFGLLAAAAALSAQGTKPRDFPAQYTAHAQLGTTWIGADFHGHFADTSKASYETPQYLVIDVAVFGPTVSKMLVEPAQFVLKVNGHALVAQPPNLVSLRLKMPALDQSRPHVEMEGGAGGAVVRTGQPPMGPQFPADPSGGQLPPPKVDTDPSRGNVEPQQVDPVDEIKRAALEKGVHTVPISGLLFYSWEGKLKKIKSLELEYSGPAGTATLDLQ